MGILRTIVLSSQLLSSLLCQQKLSAPTRMTDRVLAEVDGLFAGLIYLDETEPIISKRNRKKLLRDKLAIELDAIYKVHETGLVGNTSDAPSYTVHEDIRAREAAWSSIRTVRDGMHILWDHFVHISRRMDMALIDDIRNTYQDAKGLCYQGVLAFRYTLAGLRASGLVRIFAFWSLSYVVSRLLCARKGLEQSDILASVRLWRDALEKEDERKAFDALSEQLWPEAQSHLQVLRPDPVPQSTPFTGALKHGGSSSPASPGHFTNTIPPFSSGFAIMPPLDGAQQAQQPSNEQNMQPVLNLYQDADLGAGHIDSDAASFSMALNESLESFTNSEHDALNFPVASTQLPVTNTEAYTDTRTQSDSCSIQSLNFDMADTLSFAAPGDPMVQPVNYNNPVANPLHEPNDRPFLEITTHASAFQTTYAFKAVKEYVHHNCQFWYRLAGCGLLSKDATSCVLWYQPVQTDSIRAQTLSYIQVLSSYKHTLNAERRGIITVAEKFVE
ncbi:hypothetical protein IL306_011029 [Fusarium sp. DS 682]|nr:hypothetical protein IL306_011029 [Fusarium sp. DS 682]